VQLQIWQQQLEAVEAHTANAVLAAAEQVDYQLQHQQIQELVAHKQRVVPVDTLSTDIQELLVLHTKVEIQRMKAVEVVVVSTVVAVVETMLVAPVDLVTLHS
jgi:hypothetical protein